MKRILYILEFAIGAILLFLSFQVFDTEQTKTLSGLCIGFGSVLAVLGLGSIIYSFVVSEAKDKELKRLNKIEVNDERNIRINEKTACMVSKIMSYVLSAFIIILSFMNVDKIIIIMVASILLGKGLLFIIFSNYYAMKV